MMRELFDFVRGLEPSDERSLGSECKPVIDEIIVWADKPQKVITEDDIKKVPR